MRDTSPVSPYALMLFGGVLSSEGTRITARRPGAGRRAAASSDDESVLSVDGWIRFRVPRRVEGLIVDLRIQLDRLLQQKLANPSLVLSATATGLLDAVSVLLTSPPLQGM